MAKTMTNDQLLIREYVKQQFSAQQFADESTYFEFLAASQVLRECDLSDEEVETGLTGNCCAENCCLTYSRISN